MKWTLGQIGVRMVIHGSVLLYIVSPLVFLDGRLAPIRTRVFTGIVWTPRLEKPLLNPCRSVDTHTYAFAQIACQAKVMCALSACNEE